METVTITVKEYRELLEKSIRLEVAVEHSELKEDKDYWYRRCMKTQGELERLKGVCDESD